LQKLRSSGDFDPAEFLRIQLQPVLNLMLAMFGQSIVAATQAQGEQPEITAAAPIRRSNSTAPSLPFAHLNLRFNPFGEIPLEHRAELAVVDLESIVGQLDDRRTAFQFIGEKGRGKTTHLLALKVRFPNAAYVHIPEDEKPPIPVGNPLLIDEAQRLPRWKRWRVFRRIVPLVLGTHEDYSGELRRAGREVTTIEVGGRLGTSRLQQLLERRIEFARRGEGTVPHVTRKAIDNLLLRFGNDVRGMEGRLYEVFQTLTEPSDVEV
jgi:hypothetical protein